MDHQPFNAGAAFAFLDDVAVQFGSAESISLEPAWDATWISCTMPGRQHEAAAEAALANVIAQVRRLSVDHALVGANISAGQVTL